ncbi:hypothetical protein L3Q67_19200 [Saccharothrix sp. AJ9571]|nr:hypothetical protein L3Q67_19200 [Saccharothrix sp. AJ9571]
MAVPKIAKPLPFHLLDPAQVGVESARSRRAAEVAPTVGPDTMRPVDLVVCGSEEPMERALRSSSDCLGRIARQRRDQPRLLIPAEDDDASTGEAAASCLRGSFRESDLTVRSPPLEPRP